MPGSRKARVGGRVGFTLIELMLVVVITLLASFVAMPSFVRSLRGARLRASLRTVVMVHRYTRSLAVLQQKYAAILFDTEKQTLEVVTLSVVGGAGPDSRFLEDLAAADESLQARTEPDLVRELQQGVRIRDFQMEKSGQVKDGIYYVNYYPNGMCDAYRLRLADEKDKEVDIRVEPFSGRLEVKDR